MQGDTMKLIMESWRKFVNESIYGEEFLETLGLSYIMSDGDFQIHLVHKDMMSGRLKVIGMIETMEMADHEGGRRTPCIPETREIGTVAVDDAFRGQGLGTYLYEVAAYLVQQAEDGGITSDHSASTTNLAAKAWKRLENDLDYDKRKTPRGPDKETFDPDTGEVSPAFKGGNDEFDYTGDETPDPNDDCYLPASGKPASNNSLQIPPDRMAEVGALMKIQIKNWDSWSDEAGLTDNDLQGDASNLFQKSYKPEESGIYGDEK